MLSCNGSLTLLIVLMWYCFCHLSLWVVTIGRCTFSYTWTMRALNKLKWLTCFCSHGNICHPLKWPYLLKQRCLDNTRHESCLMFENSDTKLLLIFRMRTHFRCGTNPNLMLGELGIYPCGSWCHSIPYHLYYLRASYPFTSVFEFFIQLYIWDLQQ